MTTKIIKCIKVFQAITQMGEMDLSYTTAHKLVVAKKELQTHVDFYIEKERELIEKYAEKDENGNWEHDGKYQIPPEYVKEYLDAHNKLDSIEVEISAPWKLKELPEKVKMPIIEALMEMFELPEENE